MILKILSETGQSSMSQKHNLSRVKTGQNRLNILTRMCFSCPSFVVKPFFFPLSKDTCDGLFRVNGFQCGYIFSARKLSPYYFGFGGFEDNSKFVWWCGSTWRPVYQSVQWQKNRFCNTTDLFSYIYQKKYTRVLTGQYWLMMPSCFIHLQACSFRAEAVQPWQIHKIWNYTTSTLQL